ncbi:hypothetical protein L218DRAFT_949121 [Marasmius fiardii PR-910]|nr:hypothetical protein L218DRAFT_949121 [Marasmius fiardii PR-910]
MAPPLAGRPPFATDVPDSYYEPQPVSQRQYRQPAPPSINDRTSAYAMYDDYLNDFDSEGPPQSSASAGKLIPQAPSHTQQTLSQAHSNTPSSLSKHVLLAAAAGVSPKSPTFPQSSYQIAAPRPGYVAPIASFDLSQSTSATHRTPVTRQPPPQLAAVKSFQPQPKQQNPFDTSRHNHLQPHQPNHPGPYPPVTGQPLRYGTPLVSSTPHPLQPPISPITPVFVRPKVTNFLQDEFIMRGKAEDTVLPSRGQKGDDFWRRFSMVLHEEERSNGKKKSTWLKKTQSGKNKMSRWLWLIGIILVIVIAGAIGLGWWISHNNNTPTEPSAFGGSSKETAGPVVSKTTVHPNSSSATHVGPTFTVAKRLFVEARPTGLPRIR